MTRYHITGSAAQTSTTGSIAASGAVTISIDDAAGWPDASTGPFAVVVDPGEAAEEVCLVTARSGTNLTVTSGNRGWDGTSAAAHSPGAAIYPVVAATYVDEANAHTNDTARDDHTQYLNTTRHDVTARHTFGAALGTPAAGANVATSAAAGTGTVPAREDHVHALADSVVTTAKIATDAVTEAKLADDAVSTAKIVDAAVTTAKINDGAVTAAKLASGAVPALANDSQELTFASVTSDSDVATFTVPAFTYAAKVRFHVACHCNPTAADPTDYSLSVMTGSGGTGTRLGSAGHRPQGVNHRFTLSFATDWFDLTVDTARTFYLRMDTSNGTANLSVSTVGSTLNQWMYDVVPR